MAANSSAYKRGGGSLQEVRESKRLKQTRLADLFLPSKHQNRVLATKIDSKPEVICPLKISEESSIVQNYSPGHFGNDAPPGRDFLCTVDNTKESAALASETGGVYCSHAGGENETLPGPQCQEGEALVCSPVISLSSLSGSLSQRCGVVSMLDIDPLPSEKPTDMSISTYRDNSPPAVQSSNSNVPIETWKPGKMAKTAAASAQQRGAPLSSYEQERLDRVKRNEEFLRSLGIDHDMKTFNTEKKKMPSKKSQPKRPSVPSGPLRRSSRISGLVGEGGTPSIDKSNIDSGINGDTVAVTDPEPIEYVDTSIFRYICEESPTTSILKPHVDGPRRLLGFQVLKGELRDSSLSKIYSMDVSHGPRPLLAAAGHLGSIAVFPAWDFAQEGTCNQEGDHNEEHSQLNDGDIVEPLLSWRAGRGWISQVQFLLDQFLEEATLLLSSSNDHTVVLWNLNKEQQQIGTKRNCNPCIVSQTDSLHSQGIFGMHEKGLRLMTASKDHTLVYSTIGPASITKERTIEGHHESPLRSVRFRCISELPFLKTLTMVLGNESKRACEHALAAYNVVHFFQDQLNAPD